MSTDTSQASRLYQIIDRALPGDVIVCHSEKEWEWANEAHMIACPTKPLTLSLEDEDGNVLRTRERGRIMTRSGF